MDTSTQIKAAADFIGLRLSAYGDMTLRNLKASMLMDKTLFNQGIGWLAREGKISIIKDGWRTKISLRKQ